MHCLTKQAAITTHLTWMHYSQCIFKLLFVVIYNLLGSPINKNQYPIHVQYFFLQHVQYLFQQSTNPPEVKVAITAVDQNCDEAVKPCHVYANVIIANKKNDDVDRCNVKVPYNHSKTSCSQGRSLQCENGDHADHFGKSWLCL